MEYAYIVEETVRPSNDNGLGLVGVLALVLVVLFGTAHPAHATQGVTFYANVTIGVGKAIHLTTEGRIPLPLSIGWECEIGKETTDGKTIGRSINCTYGDAVAIASVQCDPTKVGDHDLGSMSVGNLRGPTGSVVALSISCSTPTVTQ